MISLSQFFELLVIMTITGTILFLFVEVIGVLLRGYEISFRYLLMKIVKIFFSIPAFVIAYCTIVGSYQFIEFTMKEVDFQYIHMLQGKDVVTSMVLTIEPIVTGCFLIIWLRGMVLARKAVKLIRKRLILCENSTVLQIKIAIKNKLKIKKDVLIYENEYIERPFTVRLIHPIIVIPKNRLLDKDIVYMLKHELIHC